jgi:hypothetical protein
VAERLARALRLLEETGALGRLSFSANGRNWSGMRPARRQVASGLSSGFGRMTTDTCQEQDIENGNLAVPLHTHSAETDYSARWNAAWPLFGGRLPGSPGSSIGTRFRPQRALQASGAPKR